MSASQQEKRHSKLGVYHMAVVIIENIHEILLSMRKGVVKTRKLCSSEAVILSSMEGSVSLSWNLFLIGILISLRNIAMMF